jgi:hypothetical protein
VILPTREALERRRKGYQRRGVVCGLFFVLLVAASLAPHVGVTAADGIYGRSLISASRFFVAAQADAPGFANSNDLGVVAAGLNITYLGLAMQQVGSLISLFVFFALAADGVGRWTRRGMLVCGALLVISAPTVLTGYQLMRSGGVETHLGVAWACALAAGVVMVLGGHEARKRLDSTWYWSRPEWNG